MIWICNSFGKFRKSWSNGRLYPGSVNHIDVGLGGGHNYLLGRAVALSAIELAETSVTTDGRLNVGACASGVEAAGFEDRNRVNPPNRPRFSFSPFSCLLYSTCLACASCPCCSAPRIGRMNLEEDVSTAVLSLWCCC